jgi:hypothetical protein
MMAALCAGGAWSTSAQSAVSEQAPHADAEVVAGDERAAAQALLDEGNLRFKARDFDAALIRYRRAQAVYPAAAGKVEFNIAKAERARGNEPAAAVAFARFLRLAPATDEKYRAEAAAVLRDLAAVLGTLRVEAPRPGLAVVVGGQAQGTTPIDDGIPLRAGHYVVMLEESGRVVFSADVEVRSGATVRVAMVDVTRPVDPSGKHTGSAAGTTLAALGGMTVPSAADPARRPMWKRWWVWAAGAAVVAGAVATILIMRSSCPAGVECDSINIPPPR